MSYTRGRRFLRRGIALLAPLAVLGTILPTAEATEKADPSTETVFEFATPKRLEDVVAALDSTGAQPVELRLSGTTTGGWRPPTGQPLDAAAAAFSTRHARLLALLQAELAAPDGAPRATDPVLPQASTDPEVSGGTLPGESGPAALGPLAPSVVSTETVPASDAQPDPSGPFDPPYPANTLTDQAAATIQRWAPLLGRAITNNEGGEAAIIQSQTWSSGASIRNFAADDAYEHDFKLINRDNSGEDVHPLCSDEGDNFWADRNGGLEWISNYSAAVKPYFDTDASDSCETEDFTIGIYHPLRLSAGKKYVTVIGTDLGQESSSPYALVAQRLGRGCDSNPFCVGGPFGNHGSQLLIGASKGRAPECRRWHRGRESVRCG